MLAANGANPRKWSGHRRQAEQTAPQAWCVAREVGITSKAGMSLRFRVMDVAAARSIKDSRLWRVGLQRRIGLAF